MNSLSSILRALTAVMPMGLHVNRKAFSFHRRERKMYWWI